MAEYDVLVVGAGSSGAAIAARASENPHLRVGLLEAGPDYPELADTPEDLLDSHHNSMVDHDWGLRYAPTEGRNVHLPRGRVVGGSSAVNTTIALRGVPEDYDEWAEQGNPEWAWQHVLPAFCRLERDLDFGDAPHHGDAGPIAIRRYPHEELLPQHQAFLETAQTLGYPECRDGNHPYEYGAGPQPMNKLGRMRVSTAIGYLAPARSRANLDIRPGCHVRRLLIKNGRCTGVEWQDDAGAVNETTARLVVLSAGALASPGVLVRSGIGRPDEVGSLGIDLVSAAPGVCENLSDHPSIAVLCSVHDASLIDFDAPIIQTILRYTSPGSDKRNDLQIEQISFAGTPDGPPMFVIAAVLEYQYGRGQLAITSADPLAAPVIENRFCEDERDRCILAGCFEDTLAFAQTGALAEMIDEIRFPDPRRGVERANLEALCARHSGSGYHPCGTAKMGPRSDPMAVVDQYGRCHAMDGLVVADASIMPSVPRANTNLTCIMIGERVGEWLRTTPERYGL